MRDQESLFRIIINEQYFDFAGHIATRQVGCPLVPPRGNYSPGSQTLHYGPLRIRQSRLPPGKATRSTPKQSKRAARE
jgi:hypothetical protein